MFLLLFLVSSVFLLVFTLTIMLIHIKTVEAPIIKIKVLFTDHVILVSKLFDNGVDTTADFYFTIYEENETLNGRSAAEE